MKHARLRRWRKKVCGGWRWTIENARASPLEAGVPSKMARHLFYPGDAPRGINSLGRDYACVLLKQCRTHLGIQLDARCTPNSPPSVDQRSSNLLPFLLSFSLSPCLPFRLASRLSLSPRLSLALCLAASLYRSGFWKSFRRTNAAA